MMLLTKTIHVLALGLWFGMALFFSFPVALSLFGTFEKEAQKSAKERPVWLPLSKEFDQDPASWKQPEEGKKPLFWNAEQLRKEQGTRAAGTAISPMFDLYFIVQGVCGVLALATALMWWNATPGRGTHRVRVEVLFLAALTIGAGWLMEKKVSALRIERNVATDRVLEAAPHFTSAEYNIAVNVRADFGRWHFYSLIVNFGTIALVTVAMALAAQLPTAAGPLTRREPEESTHPALA